MAAALKTFPTINSFFKKAKSDELGQQPQGTVTVTEPEDVVELAGNVRILMNLSQTLQRNGQKHF